ncbi:cytochrome P450, variant 2 [Coprinopsis cinerea AmutBmut pab1-1]|nr:cytochrome P450, variant 2 [Coprinopsis cinerea AmutBmut pab1-1]
MTSEHHIQLALLLYGFVVVVFLFLRYRLRPSHPLPPSPPGSFPLIGHMLILPHKDEWITYRQWGADLDTGILYMNVLGKKFLVINDFEVAKQLLDCRSSRYSGRPSFVMANELMGWDWPMPTLSCNQKWKNQRRMFAKHLGPASFHQPRILEFVRATLPRLVRDPDGLESHFKPMVAGIIFSLAYGIQTGEASVDANINLAQDALECFLDASNPGKHLVNMIPALKHLPEWLPGSSLHRVARQGRETMYRLLHVPFRQAQKEIAEGIARPSLVSKVLDGIQDGSTYGDPAEETIQTLKELAAVLFSAGFDTTYASIAHFFRAMAQYPDVQRKVQEELSAVIEPGRLPGFADEPRLPYLVATIKEVTRCYPVSSTGIPHMCTDDDVFEGYIIPKHTVILPNLRMMMADPIAYPDPEQFRPERFLLPSGQLNPHVRDPYSIAFGFGKRMCPGYRMAHSTLFITAATVLSLFEMKSQKTSRSLPTTSNRNPDLKGCIISRR